MKSTRIALVEIRTVANMGDVSKCYTTWQDSIAVEGSIDYIRVDVPVTHQDKALQELEAFAESPQGSETWIEGPLRSMASRGPQRWARFHVNIETTPMGNETAHVLQALKNAVCRTKCDHWGKIGP